MDLSGWFPTGNLTTWYAMILISSVLWVLRYGKEDIKDIAMIMFLSWVIARTSTYMNLIQIQILGTIFCAFFLISIRNLVSYIIIALFTLKLALYMSYVIASYNVEAMWAVSEVFAYIQIIVMVLGNLNGKPGRHKSYFGFAGWSYRRDIPDVEVTDVGLAFKRSSDNNSKISKGISEKAVQGNRR